MNERETEIETLDNFHIIKELGRGASGIVKLGLSLENGKLFAVKLLKVPALWEKFKSEYETLEKIDHSHIIRVFGLRENGTYTKKNGQKLSVSYFVMKYVRYGELFNIIYQKRSFTENLSRYYFLQLLNALEHLHSQNIYHRDLKPENLLIDEDFKLVLSDFGYAKFQPEGTLTNTRLGTPGYVAPEILCGGPYDPTKADIFSAGVTLFVIYSRNVPFKEATFTDKAYKTLFDNPAYMFGYYQQHCEKVYSDSIKRLFMNILCFNPDNRLTIEQIRKEEWVSKTVDESSALMEIQQLLGTSPVVELKSRKKHLALKVEKNFRSFGSKLSLLIAQELPKNFEEIIFVKLENIPCDFQFDFILKCKAKLEFLRCFFKAISELGGIVSEGDDKETIVKLISPTDFENILLELKLYELEEGRFAIDWIRILGSYFGFLNVKSALIKKLKEVAKNCF